MRLCFIVAVCFVSAVRADDGFLERVRQVREITAAMEAAEIPPKRSDCGCNFGGICRCEVWGMSCQCDGKLTQRKAADWRYDDAGYWWLTRGKEYLAVWHPSWGQRCRKWNAVTGAGEWQAPPVPLPKLQVSVATAPAVCRT